MKTEKLILSSGKRSRAKARTSIKPGNGSIRINKMPYQNLGFLERLEIEEVLLITKKILKKLDFDISARVSGGGKNGQIEAVRMAMANAIIKFSKSKELELVFSKYDRNILVADVRRKEPNKPGDSKARKKRQSSKR